MQVAKAFPKYLGSAEYMTLYNEARVNDGLTPLYSDAEIYNYYSGVNPYRYPNLDYYSSEYLKKAYNRSDVSAEFNGGNDRARFYANVGYMREDDLFKFGEAANDYNSRFNVRGNVDLSIADFITARANANAVFYDSRSARSTGTSFWEEAATMRPNRIAPLIPVSFIDPNSSALTDLMGLNTNIYNGCFLAGNQIEQRNAIADYYAAGYSKFTSRQFQFDTAIDFDLDMLLKGLSFQMQFAVDYSTTYSTSYNNDYAVYTPYWGAYNGSQVITDLGKIGNDKKSGVQNIYGSSDNQTIAFSAHFDYNRSFDAANGEKDAHNIKAMLLANGYQQSYSGVYHRTSNANLGLQLKYDYMKKYFAEFAGALVHSAKLAEGHRQAFSPSLSLGWNLSNENFLKESSLINDLQLSVSGSILNQDIDLAGYNMYLEKYTQAEGEWWGWHDGFSERSFNSKQGGNSNLTFIKRKELALNLRTAMLNNTVTADVNYFINLTEGLPIQPTASYPSYFSTYYPTASFIPYINFNDNRRSGVDFSLNFNKKVSEVELGLGVNGTYYTTKATKRDENYVDAYQNREGKPVDGVWGLECEGFFNTDEEAAAAKQSFGGVLRKGDLKYKDQNNDGIIDGKDEIYLGRGGWYGSPFTMGVNFTAKWKNFTLFVLGTGGFGGIRMKSNSYYWVYGDGKYSEVVRGRWTEETASTATFPRLTTESGSNNFRNSTFWQYSTNRFDIAKVQLTYDFPKRLLNKTFLTNASLYISGSNLLTISKEREYMDMNIGGAPNTRLYNLGVKVAF